MTVKEAILTLNANTLIACDRAGFNSATVKMIEDALDTINDALKEQGPKAIEYHDNPFTGLPVAHCPNCMRYAKQFHSSVEEETHYCPWCGQEVKWNG